MGKSDVASPAGNEAVRQHQGSSGSATEALPIEDLEALVAERREVWVAAKAAYDEALARLDEAKVAQCPAQVGDVVLSTGYPARGKRVQVSTIRPGHNGRFILKGHVELKGGGFGKRETYLGSQWEPLPKPAPATSTADSGSAGSATEPHQTPEPRP